VAKAKVVPAKQGGSGSTTDLIFVWVYGDFLGDDRFETGTDTVAFLVAR